MKLKIQMQIGFWGAIGFTVWGVFQFINNMMSWSLPAILVWLTTLIILVFYIVSIIRKKLTTTKTVFRVWWIYIVIILGISFIDILIGGRLTKSFDFFIWYFVSFLCWVLICGFITLILWMGLQGLERGLKVEREISEKGKGS